MFCLWYWPKVKTKADTAGTEALMRIATALEDIVGRLDGLKDHGTAILIEVQKVTRTIRTGHAISVEVMDDPRDSKPYVLTE